MYIYMCVNNLIWLQVFGASGQGLVNGILFFFLTPRVQQKFCCGFIRKVSDLTEMCRMRRQRKLQQNSFVYSESNEYQKMLKNVDISTSGRTSRISFPTSFAPMDNHSSSDSSDSSNGHYSS